MELVQHPEHHFVFDHAKWIFYAATCYTWLGDDEPAEEHAREIIAYHTNPDGSLNAPMRTANAHIDLGLSWPGMASWTRRWTMACGHSSSSEKPKRPSCHERPTLDHDLMRRYPRERLIEPFHEQYADARRRLRSQRRLRR